MLGNLLLSHGKSFHQDRSGGLVLFHSVLHPHVTVHNSVHLVGTRHKGGWI